jgi:diadenosine tetraphosphate (Ap4A) HIT family hydrolase
MPDTKCLFCQLLTSLRDAETSRDPVSGRLVHRIRELPVSVAVLGEDQFYRGYSLVIAKTHATELYQLPEPEATQYFRDMLRVAEAIATAFKPRKLNYECLGNTVPHLHWHVIPRYDGDPKAARPIWEHSHPPRVPSAEEAAATIAAIRRGL